MFCVLVVLVTWLNDDGDQGDVLLPGGVGHLQLEGVVSLLHGGQLQGGRAHPLDTERSVSLRIQVKGQCSIVILSNVVIFH